MMGLMAANPIPLTYRIVMAVAWPIVCWWGRLEVIGAELLPASGPVIVMANHDSAWDPIVVGVAALRRRQVRALAKASLWNLRPMAWVLDRMGQIPIERGRADIEAMAATIEELKTGSCIGIFPEGTVSRGRALRPLSGAGRIALAVPEAPILCAAITGAVDIVRFPKRPQIRVRFFEPDPDRAREGESARFGKPHRSLFRDAAGRRQSFSASPTRAPTGPTEPDDQLWEGMRGTRSGCG
jgi:1-acyl-sn-glycerol-3-phosphate acyltransferase